MGPFTVQTIGAIFTGLVLVLLLIPILSRGAVKIGFVDRPGGRKGHELPVPPVGGIAMFIAFCLALLLIPVTLRPYASLVVGMGLLLATGLVDDAMDISPTGKLVMQIAAAVLMVSWGEVQIHSLGNLFGTGRIWLGEWAIPFTVLCTLFMINAINMADGTDGLAGSIVIVVLFWLAVVGALYGAALSFLAITVLLIAVVVGFLFFNLRLPWQKQASVFMGDSGSMMLGFAVAWLAVYISQNRPMTIYPVTIAWILVLPVIDMISLYVRRLMKGRSPFSADQEHLHHVLLRAGYSMGTIVGLLTLLAGLFGFIGVFGWHLGWPEHYLFWSLFLVFALHHLLAARAWKLMRLIKGIPVDKAD